jgi:hypothetical protein
MPWHWNQFTGEMTSPEGKVIGVGYSGHGTGLNAPSQQHLKSIGPIPCGWYTTGHLEASHGHLGTNVAALIPDPDNEMFGRSAFYLHGRKGPLDMEASEGCIVLDYHPRLQVINSLDKRLHVTAGPPAT